MLEIKHDNAVITRSKIEKWKICKSWSRSSSPFEPKGSPDRIFGGIKRYRLIKKRRTKVVTLRSSRWYAFNNRATKNKIIINLKVQILYRFKFHIRKENNKKIFIKNVE